MRSLWLTAVLAAVSALVAAAPPAKVYQVVIDNLAFGPAPAVVHVGDTVRWVNDDLFLHSATASDHSFDLTLQPKGSGGVVMKRAGVISYICRYHPGMKGQIVVRK
ncbi:MAG TPA: plasmid stabilization protein [Caulobacteraceae bacterium]|jgi:plastocyanin